LTAGYNPSELIVVAGTLNTELPQWFNAKWMGRAFKRLGFKQKRRVSGKVEYHLIPEKVRDMADRLNVHLPDEQEKDWYSRWLGIIDKIELCHKKFNAPWVDPSNKEFIAPSTAPVVLYEEKSEKIYSELVCYWCQKSLMANDWGTPEDGFTEGKPAHTKCTNEKRDMLKVKVELVPFEDKCEAPTEEA
jgi:hypothetical protein